MVTKELELATERARLYPSSYKFLSKRAKERRTSIAQIVEELINKTAPKEM